MKRFVIEFGMGIDIHGQSVTRAAQKAVRDAVSRSCLCGLEEVLGYSLSEMNEKVVLKVTVAVTRPEDVETKELEEFLPVGEKEFTLVKGGMKISGLNISEFGDRDDSIEASLVCIEVCIKQ